MTRPILAIVALLISSVAYAQPAADPEPAGPPAAPRILFEEGRELAKEGKYVEACEKFTKSYALDHGVGTQLNLADCHEHLGHLAEAWRLFDDAAAQSASNPTRAKFARDRANALGKKIATIIVKIPDPTGATVSISGRSVPAASEIRQRLDPGPVEVIVTAPGRAVFTKTETAVAGETLTIAAPAAAPAGPDEHSEPVQVTAEGPRDSGRVRLAIGLGAVGGAGLLTSVVLGLTGRSQYNDVVNNPSLCTKTPRLECTTDGAAKIHHAQKLADVGTGFGIAAIALIAGGAVVFFTAPRETIVAPTATADSIGITVARRF
jgi:hypothetical protein